MRRLGILSAIVLIQVWFGTNAHADPAVEIESKSRRALASLIAHNEEAGALVEQAAGVLVLPDVVAMGFGVGGEYGEGVLLVDDEPVAYYALAAASFGLQVGLEYKAQVLLFLTRQSLIDFRNTQGWEMGVDATVTFLDDSFGAHSDSLSSADTVVGFIFSNKGFMGDLSLEGSKLSRIAR